MLCHWHFPTYIHQNSWQLIFSNPLTIGYIEHLIIWNVGYKTFYCRICWQHGCSHFECICVKRKPYCYEICDWNCVVTNVNLEYMMLTWMDNVMDLFLRDWKNKLPTSVCVIIVFNHGINQIFTTSMWISYYTTKRKKETHHTPRFIEQYT